MSTVGILETVWQDTRLAWRTIRKNPLFAITAALTLALGIGANTAVFTVIRSVLLKPLPYSDPDRLVRVSLGVTTVRYAEMRSAARSFSEIGFLFQVSATDLATFIGVALLLTLLALTACYIPARRAAQLDPMAALKET